VTETAANEGEAEREAETEALADDETEPEREGEELTVGFGVVVRDEEGEVDEEGDGLIDEEEVVEGAGTTATPLENSLVMADVAVAVTKLPTTQVKGGTLAMTKLAKPVASVPTLLEAM